MKRKCIRIEEARDQWKYIASSIKCRADRYQCFVYVFKIDGKEVPVLAPNRKEASLAIDTTEEVEREPELI